jgi:hypothetical protein
VSVCVCVCVWLCVVLCKQNYNSFILVRLGSSKLKKEISRNSYSLEKISGRKLWSYLKISQKIITTLGWQFSCSFGQDALLFY